MPNPQDLDLLRDAWAADRAKIAQVQTLNDQLITKVEERDALITTLESTISTQDGTISTQAATIAALENEIRDLRAQLSTWDPMLGVHRRHDTGSVTGDGADAHLEAERIGGRLLAFRTYAQFEHAPGGVKGTNRLTQMLANAARPSYFALHGGSRKWADIAAGNYDADLRWWRDFLADHMGDRHWVATLDHEPENNSQGTPEEHAAATVRMIEVLRLKDFPNCRIAAATLMDGGWQGFPLGDNRNRPDPRRWFTGYPDGMIDALGGDHYSRFPDSGSRVKPLSELAHNGVTLAGDMGLAYWIGESGCHAKPGDATSQAAKQKWITDGQAFVETFDCLGWMYSSVNATSPETDRPLDYRTDSASGVAAAWAEVCADEYWAVAA